MKNLPEGFTEQQVLDAIENAVRILAPSFTFGIYALDDIKQEARVMGLEALARYDPRPGPDGRPTRPLENFVYIHIRNRLCNLVRKKLRRSDAPCAVCHRAVGNRTEHPDGRFCQKYLAWKKRNDGKANIMCPLDLEHVADERERSTRVESDVESDASVSEALRLVDEHLPVELRATYLQMRAGQSVPKARRLVVENAVRDILRDATGDGDAC